MRNTYLLSFILLLGVATACKKEDTTPPVAASTVTALTATIDGKQQVPANTSAATGTFTGSYDSDTKELTYRVEYQGTTPTSAHIHEGGPGKTGLVIIPFAQLPSPITGKFTCTPSIAQSLLSNGTYVNIHSAADPSYRAGGEIRGDIHK